MRLTRIVGSSADVDGGGSCQGGTCPAIYETEDGDFVIQGFEVASSLKTDINLPAGEEAVRIPKSLMQAFLRTKKV